MTGKKRTALGKVGQIARAVSDIGAAETWYRDVLHLPHLYTFANLAFFDCGGTRLMLTSGDQSHPDSYVIYFQVPDIRAAYDDMQSRGIAFEGEPTMIHRHQDGTEEWMAFFKDNEGHLLAIMAQEQPGQADGTGTSQP